MTEHPSYVMNLYGERVVTPVPPLPDLVTALTIAAGDTVEHEFSDVTAFMSFRLPVGTNGAAAIAGPLSDVGAQTLLPLFPGDEPHAVAPGSKVCIRNSGSGPITVYITEIFA
jgi:hypothetical protein